MVKSLLTVRDEARRVTRCQSEARRVELSWLTSRFLRPALV
nr:hypothetical protein [Kibdelosporangium sp. MJ126-NF4]CTQ88143.1 hypothetical protein [Kibdelosporangium sp. MJ126-NF4]